MQFVSFAFLVVGEQSEDVGDQLDPGCVFVGRSIASSSSDEGDRNGGLCIKICLEDDFCLLDRAQNWFENWTCISFC